MRRPESATEMYRSLVRALSWLFAACMSALLAHAMIEWFDRFGVLGQDDYAGRDHVALGPIVAIIVALGCAGVVRLIAIRLGHADRIDAVGALGRSLQDVRPSISFVSVGFGGLLVLLAMETSEQLAATGHFQGFDNALGGSVPVGITIVLSVAGAVVLPALRFVRAALEIGVGTAEAFVTWILLGMPSFAGTLHAATHRMRRRRRSSQLTLLASSSGLRAPPTLI